MLKLLARVLKRAFGGSSPQAASSAPVQDDENAPIYESLAMTEELHDALFPKTPQMVSAIFDRPAPLDRREGSSQSPVQAAQAPAGRGGAFPIIF